MSDTDSWHSDQGEGQCKVININPGDLAVSCSDDGQYLLLYAGQTRLPIYGAMVPDPKYVEFADALQEVSLADGGRFAVDKLFGMTDGVWRSANGEWM